MTILLFLSLLPAPLIDRLANPSYRQRASAHRALAGFGRLALPHLERAAQKHSSAEVRARCDCLLRPYAEERAYREAGQLRAVLPWIDARINVAWEPPAVPHYERYLVRAREGGGQQEGPDYPDYRKATLLWVASQLVQRRPRAEIEAVLDFLSHQEADCKAACSQR